MKQKTITLMVGTLLLIAGFSVGYFYQHRELVKRDLYIANTVGNNLSEMNRLYALLGGQGLNYREEQTKFNLDMLTIIDCGLFIRTVKPEAAGEEAQYLVKGLEDALRALDANGVDRKNLVLCEARVLELTNRK